MYNTHFDLKGHLSIVRWLLRQGFEVLPEEINFDILKKTDPVDQVTDLYFVLDISC